MAGGYQAIPGRLRQSRRNPRWRARSAAGSGRAGGAFYLPANFHLATTGQQTLLAWDSVLDAAGRFQQDGVVIGYSDNAGYLVTATVTDGSASQQVLAGPFPLPIGTWFTLQVRQLLGSGTAAYSNVYVNGRLVAYSRAPTFSGTQIGHVRFGIVQLTPDAAQGAAYLASGVASSQFSAAATRQRGALNSPRRGLWQTGLFAVPVRWPGDQRL